MPQLHAGGEVHVQKIRKRARELAAAIEAAAPPPEKSPKNPTPKKKKAPASGLPKGKRLRSDQVDSIAADKDAKRQKRLAAHKQATLLLTYLLTY